MPRQRVRYWLMKSEPDVYSYDDLVRDKRTFWDGVRNYQARNLMRDEMQVGDRVLFYHSNAKPPGVAGIARVVRSAHPDPTQFDPTDKHFDPRSPTANPRWFGVDLAPVRRLKTFLSLDDLRRDPRLADMGLLRRGSRLSVQPVAASEWRAVLAMGGVKPG